MIAVIVLKVVVFIGITVIRIIGIKTLKLTYKKW